MDDKNSQELIDFSNQPLGIMAQEGSKIEEDLNKEYAENEAKRALNNNMTPVSAPENPFADVNTSPVTTPEINVLNNPEDKKEEVENGMASLNQNPSKTPTVTNEVPSEDKIELSSNMTEEERKEEIMKDLMGDGNGNVSDEQSVGEQIPSWGIFVFLLLVGVVVGAFILFKTGKIDEIFKNKEEQVEDVVPNDDSSNNVSETNEEQQTEQPQEKEVEKIRNFHVKQTEYIAMKDTVNITITGTIDLESMTGAFISTTSYNGLTSHNIDEYCDYNNSYCYIQDFDDKNKWTKGVYEVKNLSPEEKLSYVQSFGTATEISPGNYKIEVTAKDALSLVVDSESIDTSKMNLKENITVEYSIKDGYLVKAKFDFSKVVNGVDKYIVYIEMSDFNKSTQKIEIPENVINSAK